MLTGTQSSTIEHYYLDREASSAGLEETLTNTPVYKIKSNTQTLHRNLVRDGGDHDCVFEHVLSLVAGGGGGKENIQDHGSHQVHGATCSAYSEFSLIRHHFICQTL